MQDYKGTDKRSFVGGIYKRLLGLVKMDKNLVKASYRLLHLMEDTKTPEKKGFEKQMIGGAVCWWINLEKSSNGILIYLPGGGFVMGPLRLHWRYCELMSRQLDFAVVVIRYRIAPEFPFPIGL